SRTLPSRPRESPRSRASVSDLRDARRLTYTSGDFPRERRGLSGCTVVVTPLAGRTRGRCAFEDEVVLLHRGGTLPCRDGLYSWERISNPNPKFRNKWSSTLRARQSTLI